MARRGLVNGVDDDRDDHRFDRQHARAFPGHTDSLTSIGAFSRAVLLHYELDRVQPLAERAELLVHELAASVIGQGRSSLTIRAACSPLVIRFEVEGDASVPEVPLAELASRWGVRERASGTTVWFELDVPG